MDNLVNIDKSLYLPTFVQYFEFNLRIIVTSSCVHGGVLLWHLTRLISNFLQIHYHGCQVLMHRQINSSSAHRLVM